jgi:diguanylate cyclase (GGDEF)-like protein
VKILAVEDSAADLRLLREALEEGAPGSSQQLRAVSTMAAAETALAAEPFDCVLLDLGLPDGSGVDNVRRMRTVRRGQTVVVISGNESEQVALDALRHGAQDYLLKGKYTGAVVARVIRRAIERNEQMLALDREREEQFRLATRDPLTGLPNRRLMGQLAQNTLAQAARHGWRFALVYLDLDGFKEVNDRHGHARGDLLLKEVADLLMRNVRDSDSVARLGGDEFLLLLTPLLEIERARGIVSRIQTQIGAIAEVDGCPVKIYASAGVAFYPDHAQDFEALLACADQAMYRAKHDTADHWALYAPLGESPLAPTG